MALTGRQFPIAAGDHHAVVVEVGAGLRSYEVGDAPVTVAYGDDVLPPKAVGIVLVPWPNRIRDGRYTHDGTTHQLALTDPEHHTAIHGLGRWARWKPLEHTLDAVTLALDVVPQSGWPFEVRAEVTYRLDPVEGLSVSLSARNLGRERVPFGAGCHPYLSPRGGSLDEVSVQLPADTRLLLDDRGLPVGREPVGGTAHDLRTPRRLGSDRFDDAFTDLRRDEDGLARVLVDTPAGGAELWCDAAFGYLQLFTLDDLGHGAGGVAVEPMTCPPDAFNTGESVIQLEPMAGWSGRWGIRPR